MEDDEAALLAELRAISSAGSRFDDEDDGVTIATDAAAAPPRQPRPRPELDPVTKRRSEADEMESDQGDSFSLMSISSLSHQKQGESAVSNANPTQTEKKAPAPPPPSRHAAGTPPWKRKNRIVAEDSTSNNATVQENPPNISRAAALDRFADADEMTMARPYKPAPKDDRSGPAEDAELLAELRAISSKSSAADRFAGIEEEKSNDTSNNHPPPRPASPKEETLQKRLERVKRTAGTPPWKRKNKVVEAQADVVVAAPPLNNDETGKEKQTTSNSQPPASTSKVSAFPKSAFVGERGGAAEDEELLAELRQISSKSSAADRFAHDDGPGVDHSKQEPNVSTARSPVTPTAAKPPNEKTTLRAKMESLPPWKRKGSRAAMSQSQTDVDVVVVAEPKAKDEKLPPWKQKRSASSTPSDSVDVVLAAPAPKMGIKPEIPSTFQGERGGAAEDEELLKMLREVSAKSGAADRFGNADECTESNSVVPPRSQGHPNATSQRDPGKSNGTAAAERADAEKSVNVPPWKQKGRTQSTVKNDVDVVVAAPPQKLGIKSDIPSTFKGDRGGAAEDEELLAELRKISSKSGAADRFADSENGSPTEKSSDLVQKPSGPAPSDSIPAASEKPNMPGTRKGDSLPPWKQKRKNQPATKDVEVTVSAPEPKYGIKSDIPSTFQGERGGSAEDDELLAELRKISSNSGAAHRFSVQNNNVTESPPIAPNESRPSMQKEESQQADATAGYGIKSDIPSTFQGERGGAAEDEELLAELRKISSKSSADRFADEVEETSNSVVSRPPPSPHSSRQQVFKPEQRKVAISASDGSPSSPSPRRPSGLPPPKQSPRHSPQIKKGSVSVQSENPSDALENQESQAFGVKSDAPPSTFSGERGGPAEDAELLALLRGVSMKSGGANRFADDDNQTGNEAPSHPNTSSLEPPPKQVLPVSPAKVQLTSRIAPATPSSAPGDETELDRGSLPDALQSKDWKVRSRAFLFLKQLVNEACEDESWRGTVQGDDILSGLDNRIAGFLEESNANVLEKAVDFALHYADICRGASSADRARSITLSLCKKNGLSGKASTVQLASMLALKLMEVGENGSESAEAVIDVLIAHGLTSKKVKVVQASSALISQAAVEFGAAPLPLASMLSCIPKMMSHSNPKVRENGLALLAQMCRSLGSKDPVQQVLDGMRPAQLSELDALLSKKPNADPPVRTFRGMDSQVSAGDDALAALQAGAKELEAKRFAARPAVALMEVLPKTEYSSKLKLAKWSEKVAALDIALSAGGEQPYKLSSSNNYAPLISDLRPLLSHTHFAVNSKAMQVLSMLAEGVGDKLYPNLRPLLPKLLELSKDKKLTKAVASCADSFFGNVVALEHILESDVLPFLVDDKKSKNALARASALDFLERCVQRAESAGPRGSINPTMARKVGNLAVEKLSDPDVGVRNAAMKILQTLRGVENEGIQGEVEKIVDSLKSTNARAYKSLSKNESSSGANSSANRSTLPKPTDSKATTTAKPSTAKAQPPSSTTKTTSQSQSSLSRSAVPMNPFAGVLSAEADEPSLAEALSVVSSLRIPLWDSPEEDGGVLAGLKSAKWVHKQSAIKSMIAFIESDFKTLPSNGAESKLSAVLQVVKEHTKGFKESNINVMKAIFQLFSAVCEYHFSTEKVLSEWIIEDGVSILLQKISDKKHTEVCKEVLTSMCTVSKPSTVLSKASSAVQGVRAPAAHEEFMKWCRSLLDDFGASSLGQGLSDFALVLIADLLSSNPKVRRETASTMTEFYRHLGPKFRALMLSCSKKSAEKDEIEKCLESAEFDPSLQGKGPLKQSVTLSSGQDGAAGSSMDFVELPKYDLIGALPSDCIQKMNSKEGKAAWKFRKEAIDAVNDAMGKCAGIIDSTPSKPLIELTRALRDRLSDTQTNLKPLAAKAIGKVLGNMDPPAQSKLGKIVYAQILGAAMNDIKKPMRDASLESIGQIVRAPEMDGGAVNRDAIEGLVGALSTEINETAVKSAGLASVLQFLRTIVADFPHLDDIAASRGESLGEKYASVLIECLVSSKAETRSESTLLVKEYVEKGVLSGSTFRKASEKLKPAKQRTVKPILESLTASSSGSPEKENKPSTSLHGQSNEDEAEGQRSMTPRGTSSSASGTHMASRSTRKEGTDRPTPRVLAGKSSTLAKTGVSTKDFDTSHPLVSRVSTRVPSRPMMWPEFPEEPLGAAIFANLKKGWSTALPQTSIMKLFPATGIKKQDDAKEGCELLSLSLSMDHAKEKSVVVEQLDYILKWICLVLCSKEATVGLQALLDLVRDLFNFLVERKRHLSDSECMVLVPFIIERAGNAKGRFRESFFDIVGILQSYQLVPASRLGPVGCVSVIERSGHAKARVLACSVCLGCVDSVGLAGIGKKGVVSAAKSLSDEHIAENKNAILDLLESILERMNGDMQRFVRICGPGFDKKARELLEERWQKSHHKNGQTEMQRNIKLSPPRQSFAASSVSQAPDTPEGKASVLDELPALSLRDGAFPDKSSRKPSLQHGSLGGASSSSTGALGKKERENLASSDHRTRELPPISASSLDGSTFKSEDNGPPKSEGLGTAAVLRARLLKLKEKTIESFDEDAAVTAMKTFESVEEEYEHSLVVLQRVLDFPTPISDFAPEMIAAVSSLKRLHAALSQQQHGGEDMRGVIASRLPETLEYLTRIIGFSCDCGDPSVKAGMSIQLLSVCLATLIALFKDNEIATQVTQEDLMLLIRETATALLDPRFVPGASDLDDATSTQMVRAINKTTISAASGVPRHVSLQALLTIQQQVSLEPTDDPDSDAFHRRLSRVITKLFNRVIRHEEGMATPFATSSIDLESLLCQMEDSLVACGRAETEASGIEPVVIAVCRDMVKALTESIVKCHGGTKVLIDIMDELGIDSDTSDLGRLVRAGQAPVSQNVDSSLPPRPTADTHRGPSVGVLVSAFVNAKEPIERQKALADLRAYKKEHGESDLHAHLDQVSPAFRAFLEEQLSALNEASPEKKPTPEKVSSMSERLRSLRSRIAGNDLKVATDGLGANTSSHSTASPLPSASSQSLGLIPVAASAHAEPMDQGHSMHNPEQHSSSDPVPSPVAETGATPRTTGIPSPASALRSSRLAHPSPSKLPTPSSFRERLAASSHHTAAATTQSNSNRAAALRARLEAVRSQGK